MDFIELAYRRLEERWIQTSDYIKWANDLLEAGSVAPSVAELASCCWEVDPDAQQVERIFQSCVQELGLTLPDGWYVALCSFASSRCTKMLSGAMQPWDLVQEMLTLSDDNNEPYILWIWIDLTRDLSNFFPEKQEHINFNGVLDLTKSDECIRKTAQQFIDLCSAALPLRFPWIWWCQHCGATSEENTFTENRTVACSSCATISAMQNMRFFEHRDALITHTRRYLRRD